MFLAGYLAVLTIGYGLPHPIRASTNEFLNLPARWDAGWYVGIASGGYRWNPLKPPYERLKFFPGYPLLLRAVAVPLDPARHEVVWLWIGVTLSTLLFWLALLYVFRIASMHTDVEAGRRAVWVTASYPFAVFFGVPYSESLFLASACAAFYRYRRGDWAASGAWGCVAGLARPNGFLVSAALVLTRPSGSASRGRISIGRAAAALAPFLGTLLFSVYLYVTTGDALAWMVGQPGGRRALDPAVFLRDIGASCWDVGASECIASHGYDILNILAAVIPTALALPIFATLGAGAAAFVALNTLMPLLGVGFNCMGRYTSVMFPMFLWMAVRIKGRQFKWWIAASLVCQALVAAAFFTWRPLY